MQNIRSSHGRAKKSSIVLFRPVNITRVDLAEACNRTPALGIKTLFESLHKTHLIYAEKRLLEKRTRLNMEQADKRVKYGFCEFNFGDAWRYYSVSLARACSAAKMFWPTSRNEIEGPAGR